jgi:hypothetical protein
MSGGYRRLIIGGVHYLPDDPPDLVARKLRGSTYPISRHGGTTIFL